MKIRKTLTLMLAGAMVFAMCACGSAEQEAPASSSSAGLTNPLTECTQEELLEATGLDLAAPEGAENASWAYIGTSDGNIAQVQFDLDENTFCYRAEATSITSIFDSPSQEATESEITDALNNSVAIGTELSGMYYEWECLSNTIFEERDSVTAFNEGDEGFICWLDVVPGILYSLSTDDNASQQLLEETAAKCFVPVQGDSE